LAGCVELHVIGFGRISAFAAYSCEADETEAGQTTQSRTAHENLRALHAAGSQILGELSKARNLAGPTGAAAIRGELRALTSPATKLCRGA
jgi:hypothetical protein